MLLNAIQNFINPDTSYVLKQKHHTKAVLVLVGLGSQTINWQLLGQSFSQIGDMDVFVPDYIGRNSIDESVHNLANFIAFHDLASYTELHVFTFILGGVVFNHYLQKNSLQNLKSIVYDRSPLQEHAPDIVVQRIPFAKKMIGNVIEDLAQTGFPPCPVSDIPIGLVIENKATRLMRLFRKDVISRQTVDWHPDSFQQAYADYVYIPLNHDELYFRMERIIADVAHFFAGGCFPVTAQRTPFTKNPFN